MTLEQRIEAAMSNMGLAVEMNRARLRNIPEVGRRKVVYFQCSDLQPGDFERAKLAIDGPFILMNSDESSDGKLAAFEVRDTN